METDSQPRSQRQADKHGDRETVSQPAQIDRQKAKQSETGTQTSMETDRPPSSLSVSQGQTHKHRDRVAGQPEIGRLTDRQARRQSQQASQR